MMLHPALRLDGRELRLLQLRGDVVDSLLVADRLHRARREFQQLHDDVERALAAPEIGLHFGLHFGLRLGLHLGLHRKHEQCERRYRGEPRKAKAGNFRRHQNVSVGYPQAGLLAPS
jgi:hypothetical protein